MKVITGGVTAAKGFQAASTAAGIKYQGRTDMAMVYSEKPCVAAGTFTTNIVKAAPVKWDQEIVYKHPSAQVIVCNSGIANACTGEEGFSYCRADSKSSSRDSETSDENSVLVASTGVIGMQLPIEKTYRRCQGNGSEAQRNSGSRKRSSQSNHDNRYRRERSCRRDRDRRQDSYDRRHVQGIRNDPSEYVHDAWFCHNRRMHFQAASPGSSEPGCQRYL